MYSSYKLILTVVYLTNTIYKMSCTTTTNGYKEAERDLIKKLTDYEKIEEIMGDANTIKRAVNKYKSPIASLDDLESSLENIEDDDYYNYFDRVFLVMIVNNCSPDTILNKEQYNIIIDYTFAINHREKKVPIKQFISQNQEALHKYRKWVAKEQKQNGNKCTIC